MRCNAKYRKHDLKLECRAGIDGGELAARRATCLSKPICFQSSLGSFGNFAFGGASEMVGQFKLRNSGLV
jgi:hypothetical protein